MEAIDIGKAGSLNLPRLGQLGFVVDSIEDSLPYYASFYGLDTWFKPKYVQKQYQAGGKHLDLDLDLTFAYSGNTQIELIATRAQEENLYHRHLAEYGGGLHHLGFYVNNLDERTRVMRELGIGVLVEGEFKTAGGGLARFAYLDTKQVFGIILEVIEIRLYGINVPQNSLMMKVAAITGDVLKTKR
jgi:catechol 2,3-dioxygenase-like lactoylglutathione lyase family enzyme